MDKDISTQLVVLGEICLAIEMGADAEDLALTIHDAYPTLHETVGLVAEVFEGSITDYFVS